MTAATLSDEAILASLKAHPGLRDRFASIIEAIRDGEETSRRPMRSRSGSWRRCGCWGGRRCRDGPRTRSKRRNEKFVDKLRCIAKVKKTPLAYEIRRGRGLRAAIPVREEARSPVHAQRESRFSGLFRPTAARDRRLRRGSAFRSGARQVARALRLRDRREHDPEGYTRPCRNMFEAGKISLDFPEAPGRHKGHRC